MAFRVLPCVMATWRRTGLIAVAAVVVVVLGVLLAGRAIRLGTYQVYVDGALTLEDHFAAAARLSEAGATVREGQPGSPDDVDAVLGLLRYTERQSGLRLEGTAPTAFAVDPFLFYPNTQLVSLGVRAPYRGSLEALLETGRRASGAGAPIVAVAGNNPADFAALVIYIAREYLSPADYSQFRQLLRSPGLAASGVIPDYLRPLVAKLRLWAESGILASNWTNQDDRALQLALQGDPAPQLFFVPRSFRKTLNRIEAFGLEPILPVPAQGNLNFILVGRALGLRPGFGPLADSTAGFAQELLQPDFQLAIEESSLWTPLVEASKWVDANHRTAVEGIRNAQDLVYLDTTLLAHPVWQAIRLALR